MASIQETDFSGVKVLTVLDEEAGLSFSVAPASGGELSSLRARWKGEWVELLYRANRFEPPGRSWRGRAPWLFPAVGRSFYGGKMGRYALDGKVYAMPIHGFVMQRAWELAGAEGTGVICRTSSDAATRALYPFDFELTASYRLEARGLSARFQAAASAANTDPMPFSVGNHLTLAVRGAALVRSPARERLLLSADGLLTGRSKPAGLETGRFLGETPELGDMVLAGFPPGQCWAELRDPASLGLRVTAKTAAEPSLFVFYADPRRSLFFCPEPWYGSPNSLNEGRGLVRLAPGERFAWELELSLV